MAVSMSSYSRNKLDCKDLHGYLRTLPAGILDKLYNHPATCLAVFRELPQLARHYVMRVLFIDQPVAQAGVSSWVKASHQSQHHDAVGTLSGLRVWHDTPLPGGLPGWQLNRIFRENLKVALIGGGKPWSSTPENPAEGNVRDVAFLDNYAKERWECILHFLVGSRGPEALSRDIALVLTNSGLMKIPEGATLPVITPAGFQFLLLDTSSQVWYFMLQYLETSEARDTNLVNQLSFLFQLSFSTLGKDYGSEGMSESQLQFLQHLRELGLVFQRKRKSGRYFPTRLAINLASGLRNVNFDAQREGFIVIETNYRVYAYTDSDLQIEILGLFCQLLYRFPNMSVGMLTRESVQQAVANGITAAQILHYLRSHAHPQMLANKPVIPPTISDQVRLWELERERLTFTHGILYNDFLSQPDFDILRDYAKDLGVLTWEDPKRRVLVIAPEGHEDIKRFWKRQRKGHSS